jgi:2-dehydropantoate 2-reductase
MRVLVVGAGALGGYYGGRLACAGRDVTFLVRPRRAEEIARNGLRIDSVKGDADLRPQIVVAGGLSARYELVLLAVKAYSLDVAISDLAPAVGPDTTILPVVNGMRHLDVLATRFDAGRVLGGAAFITATLGLNGQVVHRVAPKDELVFGEIDGRMSKRVGAMADLFDGAGFEARASQNILQDMWEKWVLLAALAAANCLMRGSVGDILGSPGGREVLLSSFEECRAVARKTGHEPRPEFVAFAQGLLTAESSPLVASMLRDVERGSATEGEHVLGDMVERAERVGVSTPLLRLARCHVSVYEARRRATQRDATVPADPAKIVSPVPDEQAGDKGGTATWVQAMDETGQIRATKAVPEPDSLGG